MSGSSRQRGFLWLAVGLAAAGIVVVLLTRQGDPRVSVTSLSSDEAHPNFSSDAAPRPLADEPKASEPPLVPAKRYSEMTVPERNHLANELKNLSAAALAERLFGGMQSNGDRMLIDLQWRLLAQKLQSDLPESEKREIYGRLQSLLLDPGLRQDHKSELIQMLGRTATPESLGLLVQLAQDQSLPRFNELVNQMIASAGEVQWGDRFHQELSPVLEQAWSRAEGVPGLKESLAKAIAGVGAPSGIELLYSEALRAGSTVSQFSEQEDNLSWEVLDAFQRIRNPEAVPLLAGRLGEQPLDSMELVLSGEALAAMGRPEATGALLRWAEGSQRDVAQLVEPWMGRVRDPDSFELLEAAAASPARFINAENWKALDRALREWKASRVTQEGEG